MGYGVWGGFKILGLQILDLFDFISNSILMPIAAFLLCIVVGYIVKPGFLIEEVELNGKFKLKGLFTVMIKYVAPVCLVIILVSSILDVFGVLKI